MGTSITSPTEKVPVGSILLFGGATAPDGYLLCDGQTYNNVDYPDLYAVIGTTFGTAGVGSFAVPQLCSYLAKGADTAIGGLEPVGHAGGTARGQHHHDIGVAGGVLITSVASAGNQANGGAINTLTQRAHTHNVVGATDTAEVQPQYLCVNFIIKT